MDKPHPITLNQVFFTRTVVVAMPEHKAPDKGPIKHLPENSLDVSLLPEMQGHYVATMRTRINSDSDSSDPYLVDMECVGFFTVDESLNDADAKRGVTITAHTVLYGAIRESIAWITGRHPHGPLILGLSVLQSKQPTKTKD